jgi:lipoyl-dependent peroxiredoxin
MNIRRNAKAIWQGTGKEGKGHLSTASTVLNETAYSFNTRFAEGVGTNPEELISAALAGCFSMKLAFNLQGVGFAAQQIETTATTILENGGIQVIELNLTVQVADIETVKLEELILDAKANCPISKLMNAEIRLSWQRI